MRECVGHLTPVVLQVGSVDRWIWHLHLSQCYSVSSAYNKLSEVDINQHHNSHKVVRLRLFLLRYLFLLGGFCVIECQQGIIYYNSAS